jgi:hypothetical protein
VGEYPRLKEIGIDDPALITSYAINSLNRVDILRIRQKRESGSLLPTRRSWEFPRIQQTPIPDKKRGTVLATSPILREIKAELDQLLEERNQKQSTVEAIRYQLQALENEFEMRVNAIRETLAELEKE